MRAGAKPDAGGMSADLIVVGRADAAVFLDGRKASTVPGLHRVRRGTYVTESTWRGAKQREQYRMLVRATVPALRRAAPLAHESAAVLLGIPVIGPWPSRVHVLDKTAAGGRSSAVVTRHGTRTMPELTEVDGVDTTSPARTVVDLARTRSFASGIAAADYVLHAGMASLGELKAELEAARRSPGLRRARLVIAHADERAESVGESLSRAQMIELGQSVPVLQQEFYDGAGFIGRTDFWWPELRIAGEFDGEVKFGREIHASDEDAREALWREKQREDRLRRQVNGIVRWTWKEAMSRTSLARLLAQYGIR